MSADSISDKANRLFKFLREMKKLELRATYDVNRYEEVLWLHSVPRAAECDCVVFGETRGQHRQSLLEVHKPRFDPAPGPDDRILPWLTPHADLADSSVEPALLQAGPRQESCPDDVQTEWRDFLTRRWSPWAAADRLRRAVFDAYTRLFSIYQKVERQGDQFDLVVGIGCLSWNTPSDHKVLRHLVTLPASLKFDAAAGVIRITPDTEGWFSLEQDMLEAKERPPAKVQRNAEEKLGAMESGSWSAEILNQILAAWVNALTPDGQFSPSLEPPPAGAEHPTVHFAPALILRRRTQSAMIEFYDGIIEQLEKGGPVPESVRRLVETADDKEPEEDVHPAAEFLFPLPANDEQREVARQIMAKQGVVVQGPPGTGKSHTIANIVCHLLANGMRVLVTSHTARALRVLQDKMPEGISSLCVPLLGKDVEAQIALQRAVAELHKRADDGSGAAARKRATELEEVLRRLRKEEESLRRELRTVREREVYRYDISSYSGTPEQIALRLRADQARFSWLPTRPAEDALPPLSNEEAVELLDLLRRAGQVPEAEIAKDVGDVAALCSEEEFAKLAEAERSTKLRHDAAAAARQHPTYAALASLDPQKRRAIQEAGTEFRAASDRLRSVAEAWVGRAAAEVLSGRERAWRELLEHTKTSVASLATLASEVADYRVDGAEGLDRSVLKAQAIDLLDHLQSGAGRGFGPFKPPAVRNAANWSGSVRVNGRLCSATEALRQLVNWLDVGDRLAALRTRWSGVAEVQAGASAQAQLADFDVLCRRLEQVFAVGRKLDPLKAILESCAGCPEPQWQQPADVSAFLAAAEAADIESELSSTALPFENLLSRYRAGVNGVSQHPVVERLAQAVVNRDVAAYAAARSTVAQIVQLRRESGRRRELLVRLQAGAPAVAAELQRSPEEETWDGRLASLVEAWDWAKADLWLGRIGNGNSRSPATGRIGDVQRDILTCLAELAAVRTWGHCARRLTLPLRSALQAWSHVQQRIGKGKGKYIEEWLAEAKRCMKECTPAIPAWTMPIQRVCETVKPAPDAFDVVIVDEASQSGPDALLLCYIARKLVVVGDDKQISPTAFTDRSFESELRQKYIPDLPFAQLLGVDSSLFDQAQIRYPGRIRLREHFRCMPEIIEFSNRLCYSDQPLIPLRQYGAQRLAPIRTTLVESACQEGRTGRVVNRGEADAVVEQIRRCIKLPEYRGKTMGVISLLGADQAKLIEDKLLRAPDIGPEEMDRHRLICGDAYAFQGDERDVMFLSLVVSAEEGRRIAALTHRSDQQRFNVAASRARDQLWLFHSLGLSDLRNEECVRFKLLNYCLSPWTTPLPAGRGDINELARAADTADRMQEKPPHPFDSWFEVDVFLRVAGRGYRVVPQYAALGYSLDMVIEGAAHRLAVECDGDYWHGPERFEADMVRQANLERVGWQFWRVRGSAYYRAPEQALAGLWETLDKLGIGPQPAAVADSKPSSN